MRSSIFASPRPSLTAVARICICCLSAQGKAAVAKENGREPNHGAACVMCTTADPGLYMGISEHNRRQTKPTPGPPGCHPTATTHRVINSKRTSQHHRRQQSFEATVTTQHHPRRNKTVFYCCSVSQIFRTCGYVASRHVKKSLRLQEPLLNTSIPRSQSQSRPVSAWKVVLSFFADLLFSDFFSRNS